MVMSQSAPICKVIMAEYTESDVYIDLDKNMYQVNIFLISPRKYMLVGIR